jgi:type IV secretion system protein VirB9
MRMIAGLVVAAAACLLAVPLAAPLAAEITPQPGTGDPHIQSVPYDADQVVALRVAAGYAVTIAFSPDERIETVTVGDSGSWQVQANRRADHLVVKPVGGGGSTNLTVITDARVYNFTLYGASGGDPSLPYTLSFTYPPPPGAQVETVPPTLASYRLHGDRALWPAALSDDGEATSIVWPSATTLPAVYQDDEAGKEALVNGLMHEGTYVIQGVHKRLVFRRGKESAIATRIVPRPKKDKDR